VVRQTILSLDENSSCGCPDDVSKATL